MVTHLLERNTHWSSETRSNRPALLKELSQGQAPKVLWIGCADSRVPESVVCGADPGEIFVTRNIANQFRLDDDNAVSVLTYAIQALGVEHVVVVGHTSCGGVLAAIQVSEQGPPSLERSNSPLFRHLAPLTKLAWLVSQENPNLKGPELVEQVTFESVNEQVNNVMTTDVIRDNWEGKVSPLSGKVMKKVEVHGWIYDIGHGQLKDLGLTRAPPA